ncbi:hypothetical protein E2C01_018439 [Portunus trituberculatus]|uniref:Uncharacterized protein n=1 Tax=Portunus trituberculatus TaxID=210409 RepID=A0A5B7DWE8_PORTR|nr:hypothetical protein [Portunus trituberculatus]
MEGERLSGGWQKGAAPAPSTPNHPPVPGTPRLQTARRGLSRGDHAAVQAPKHTARRQTGCVGCVGLRVVLLLPLVHDLFAAVSGRVLVIWLKVLCIVRVRSGDEWRPRDSARCQQIEPCTLQKDHGWSIDPYR